MIKMRRETFLYFDIDRVWIHWMVMIFSNVMQRRENMLLKNYYDICYVNVPMLVSIKKKLPMIKINRERFYLKNKNIHGKNNMQSLMMNILWNVSFIPINSTFVPSSNRQWIKYLLLLHWSLIWLACLSHRCHQKY